MLVGVNLYDDPHALHDFLKNIKTVKEFFEKKEPAFNDAFMRETAIIMMEDGESEDYVLSGLKANERQQYAEKLKERKSPN